MPSVFQEAQQAIADIAKGPGAARAGFAARAAAIELLEIHVLDRLRYLGERRRLPAELQALCARARALRKRLEAANEGLSHALRRRIQSGECTGSRLHRVLTRSAGPPGRPGDYDALDLLISGVLHTGARPREPSVREAEMIAYQPTPARAILELIARANLSRDDVFYDLGSGLGHVVMLVALLSGARAIGIEFEPAYVSYARRCARSLRLQNIEFVQADAREVNLEGGSVFFMYSPFQGELLRKVLDRLRAEATKRPIRVCTLGPCTFVTASVGWLRPGDDRALSENQVAVFNSVRQGRGGCQST
jgi:SAM-dependent methyltransferase